MKSLFIFLIYLLLIVKNQDTTVESYSVNSFIDYIQNNGYWDIFQEVKNKFGIDVSIEFCQAIVPSPHCDEVVRVYIPKTNHGNITEDEEEPEISYLDINDLDYFLENNNFIGILTQNITYSQLVKLIGKIKMKFN